MTNSRIRNFGQCIEYCRAGKWFCQMCSPAWCSSAFSLLNQIIWNATWARRFTRQTTDTTIQSIKLITVRGVILPMFQKLKSPSWRKNFISGYQISRAVRQTQSTLNTALQKFIEFGAIHFCPQISFVVQLQCNQLFQILRLHEFPGST